MTDIHTKEQRSKNMSAIKSRHNLSTEIALIKLFKVKKIKGWRRHVKSLPGTPDFIFSKYKAVIFVDGCFWHGCKKCNLQPKTNVNFWNKKIKENKERDKFIKLKLKKAGWEVLRIWEHDIKKKPILIMNKLENFLMSKK